MTLPLEPRRYAFLDIWVNDLTVSRLRALIAEAIDHNKKIVIGNHNLHSLYLYHHSSAMRSFYDDICDYVHIDGMPILWIGRLFGHKLTVENRIAIIDWLKDVLQDCLMNSYRVFFLGATERSCEGAKRYFQRLLPGLILDVHHGFFDARPGSDENSRVVEIINGFRPHLLIVGMGMPRQEIWIRQNIDELQANVIMNQGAFMDYFSGEAKVPPRWSSTVGMEWAFRLISNPRRLWRRYLLEPWFIMWLVIASFLRATRA